MSEHKHSPGPWAVAGGYIADATGTRAVARFVPPEDSVVVWAGETADHLTLANGRLLAAAPDLLAVAKQAVAAFRHLSISASTKEGREEFGRLEANARAVVAKIHSPLTDASHLPDQIIPAEEWDHFCDWARDIGYDESYLNPWDSKSITLQQQYLDEKSESLAKGGPQP